MAIPPPGVGRPRKRERDEPRQYVGFPVPVSVKTRLEAAAKANGRSLSAEAALRLQQSLDAGADPFFPSPLRNMALRLIGQYTRDDERYGGASGVVLLLLGLEDPHTFETPDRAEMARRRQAMVQAAIEYAEPDAERDDDFFVWLARRAEVFGEGRRARRTKPEPEKE